MSLIGQVLQDRYRIAHEIGEGGMGRVYYAEDIRLNQQVAIKETLAPKNEPPQHIAARVKAFQREAHLLAGKIKHHAIPRVIDYFQFGETWFIVMDYVDGDSLEKQLQKRGEPFSPDEVLSWTDQLLEILDSLHSGTPQVIHRDIKPSNIKVKSDKVYLLDFGLAKQLTGSKTSIALFTPSFSPPEQMENKEPTPKSDLYSVGATMYCLLTNAEPANAFSRSLAIAGGEADPLRHIKELRADLPDDIAALIMSALSIKPEHRPESAEAMRLTLKGLAAKKEQAPQQQTTPDAAAMGGAGTGADGPGAAGDDEAQLPPPSKTIMSSLPPHFNTKSQPAAPRPRKQNWRRAAVALLLLAMVGLAGFIVYSQAVRTPEPPRVPPRPPRQVAAELTEQAMQMLYVNDYERAKALSREALDNDPTYALAHAIYGDAFWDSEHTEEDSSKNPKTQFSKGEILKLFDAREPSTAEDFAARGWALLIDRKWVKAKEDIEKVIAQKPEWAWALVQKAFVAGRGCVKEKDSQESLDAINIFKKVNSLQPRYAIAHMNLAQEYRCNKQNQEALASYEEALKLWPVPRFYLARGFFYLDIIEKKTKQKNIELARKDFERALEIDSQFGDSHLGLARIHAEQDQYKECIAEADKALSMKQSFEGYSARASCRLILASKEKDEQGFDEALDNMEKAKEELNKYGDQAEEQKTRGRYYYEKAQIHNTKANYLFAEKYLKSRTAANKARVSAELEHARTAIGNALAINDHKDLNKDYEKLKKTIDENARILKRV